MPGTQEVTQQMASIIIIQIQPIKVEMLTAFQREGHHANTCIYLTVHTSAKGREVIIPISDVMRTQRKIVDLWDNCKPSCMWALSQDLGKASIIIKA